MVLKSAELINGEWRTSGNHQGVLAQEEQKEKPGWRTESAAGQGIVVHRGVPRTWVASCLTGTRSQTPFIRQ